MSNSPKRKSESNSCPEAQSQSLDKVGINIDPPGCLGQSAIRFLYGLVVKGLFLLQCRLARRCNNGCLGLGLLCELFDTEMCRLRYFCSLLLALEPKVLLDILANFCSCLDLKAKILLKLSSETSISLLRVRNALLEIGDASLNSLSSCKRCGIDCRLAEVLDGW